VAQTANLALRKYAFVVLSDVAALPASFESALGSYVRAGGSLLVALGRESALRRRVPVFDEGIIDTRYFARDGDRFQTAAWLDSAYPSIHGAGRWDDVKFYQAVRIQPGSARVAARLGDETPLLLEKQLGEGRVLVFASTFDNISNDFPLHASFVPFIEHTANYLARQEEGPANYTVGSYLELRQAKEQGAAVEVLDPKGRARADAGRSRARAEHAAHYGRVLRCAAAQRPARVGGGECGSPRVGPGRDSGGDAGAVAEYGASSAGCRRGGERGGTQAGGAMVVCSAGGASAGGSRIAGGKPASGGGEGRG
jgi:hypothetical protein